MFFLVSSPACSVFLRPPLGVSQSNRLTSLYVHLHVSSANKCIQQSLLSSPQNEARKLRQKKKKNCTFAIHLFCKRTKLFFTFGQGLMSFTFCGMLHKLHTNFFQRARCSSCVTAINLYVEMVR